MKCKDNPVLATLIDSLSKEKKPVWKRVMNELSRSRRQKVEVNLSKIERYGGEGSTILIPGTVLGSGTLSKKMTIAAFRFSSSARKIIKESGGKAVTIENLMKTNPEGKGVVLLK